MTRFPKDFEYTGPKQFNKLGDYLGDHVLKVVSVEEKTKDDGAVLFGLGFVVEASTNEKLAAKIKSDGPVAVEHTEFRNYNPKYHLYYYRSVADFLDCVREDRGEADWDKELEAAEDGKYNGRQVLASVSLGAPSEKHAGKQFPKVRFERA